MTHGYIIGLDPGYRGAALETQLAEAGTSVERVPGVLAAELPGHPDDYADQAASRVLLRRELTVGEIGCALAHRSAYEAFLATADAWAAVFEDDARIVVSCDLERFGPLLDTDRPTVLLLYSWTTGLVARRHVAEYRESGQADAIGVWESATTPLTATAYLLNRAAAILLMDAGRPVSSVADWPANPASRMRFLFAYPWLARPDPVADSTLEGSRAMEGAIDEGSAATKALRHLNALLHITWLRKRHAYLDYRAYRYHEFDRLTRAWLARRLGRNIVEGDPLSPRYTAGNRAARLRMRPSS